MAVAEMMGERIRRLTGDVGTAEAGRDRSGLSQVSHDEVNIFSQSSRRSRMISLSSAGDTSW